MSTSPGAAPEVGRAAPAAPRLGIYLGAGCMGAFVLAAITSLVALLAVHRTAAPPSPVGAAAPLPGLPGLPGLPPIPGVTTGDADAEVLDLRMFDGDASGSYHVFVAEISSTGDEPLAAPNAVVSAYDAAGLLLQTCNCSSVLRELPPGEKAPCTCAIHRAGPLASYRAEVSATPAVARGRTPVLEVADVVFSAAEPSHPHQLGGRVTNKSPFRAASAWAIVSLYGADGKIVGMNEVNIAGAGIEPGKSATFTANIAAVAAHPDSYVVKAVGYE